MPAGRAADRLGQRGPVLVLTVGVAGFAAAYALLAIPSPGLWALVVPFLLAGAGIGAVETAQHAAIAALAPPQLRGSAFGVLATVQSLGNLAASAAGGLLWTAVSPTAAFGYLIGWMLLAMAGLLLVARPRRHA